MTLRIMPLGDSITDGLGAGGYRFYLYTMLTAAVVGFDFVGSQNSATGLFPDEDHEGHSGWRLDMMDAAVAGWLATNPADMILLLGGTNDIALMGRSGATCAAELESLLTTIYAVSPATTTIVATPPHMDVTLGWENERLIYASLIPGVLAARRAAGQSLLSIDGTAGVETADMYGHLTPSGYATLAARWYAAINPTLTYRLPETAAYVFKEDWAGTGTLAFAGALDDVSAYLIDRVTIERGRDQGRVTGGPKASSLRLTLANEDGTFATERVDSPLHGQLNPGKLCRFGGVLGSDVAIDDGVVAIDDAEALIDGTADLPLFTGRTADPGEKYQIGDQTVAVVAYGLMNRLVGNKISIPYHAAITTGSAMVLVYQAAGLGADEYVVDPGAITGGRTLLHWSVDGRTAMEVSREIWATEGPPAAHLERADGRLEFQGRFYRTLTERSLVVQQTFMDSTADHYAAAIDSEAVPIDDVRYDLNGETSTLWHTDPFSYDPSYGSVVNDLTIQVEERAAQALQKVWEASGPIVLGPSESRDVFATSSSGDPLTNIQTPAVTTDYTLAAPGTLASVAVTAISGVTARIRLVAMPAGCTINPPVGGTGLQLRAQPVAVFSTQNVPPTIDPTDSQLAFGKKGLPQELSIWRCLPTAEAAGLGDAYLLAYPRPRGVVTVTIENATGPLLLECFAREVGDLIHVFHARSGVDLDVTVEQFNHTITTGGRHTTTLLCERNVRLDWALYDVSHYDDEDARYGQ